jgi:hypothetical protein
MAKQNLMAVTGSTHTGPRAGVFRVPSPCDGSVTQVFIVSPTVNTNGDAVFDAKLAGVTLFPDTTTRPRILASNSIGYANLVKGVWPVSKGQELTIDVVSVASGGIGGPLYLMIVVDDALTTTKWTSDLYLGALNRAPTSGESSAMVAALNGSMTSPLALRTQANTQAIAVLNGSAYLARSRTDVQFIQDLYLALLGRVADSGGQAYWLAQLLTQGGTQTRLALITAFVLEVESVNTRLGDIYGGSIPYGDAKYIAGISLPLASPADQQTFKFDSATGKFVWVTFPTGLTTLSPSPAGTYGDSTHYPIVQVDAQGRTVVASQAALPVGLTTLSPDPSGVYGDGTHYALVQVDAQGRVIAASQASLPSGLPSRASATYTTASLANNADEVGSVALGKSGRLFVIAADRACRVRIYATAAKRDNDRARSVSASRTANDLLFAELVFTASFLSVGTQDPVVLYYNLDSPTVLGLVYLTVQNTSGATSTVAVTFTYVNMEA